MPVAGWLGDRLGRHLVLACGFVAYGVALIAYVVAPRSGGILVGQIFRAVAFGCYGASAMTYAAETVSRATRGRLFGVLGTAGTIGATIGSWWGGTATDWFGFVPMFWGCVGILGIGALAAWRLGPPRRVIA